MAVSSLRPAADVRMWFAAISLLAIVAANAVLASVLTRFISERIQLREAEIAQEFLAGILKAEGGEAKLFSTPAPSAELISFAEQVRSIPGIVRANIYSPDMFIRFSTEPSLTGLKFDGNSELSDSFRGELVSKIEAVSDIDKSEHIALEQPRGGRLIEAYIPVKDTQGRVATVVEFYKDPGGIEAIIGEVTRLIWASAAVSGLLLFLILGAVFAFGSRKSGPRGISPGSSDGPSAKG